VPPQLLSASYPLQSPVILTARLLRALQACTSPAPRESVK
jgi:hypothetical protein